MRNKFCLKDRKNHISISLISISLSLRRRKFWVAMKIVTVFLKCSAVMYEIEPTMRFITRLSCSIAWLKSNYILHVLTPVQMFSKSKERLVRAVGNVC